MQEAKNQEFDITIIVDVYGPQKIGLDYSKRFHDINEAKNNDMQIYEDIGIKGAISFINTKKAETNHPIFIKRVCKNYATFFKVCKSLEQGTNLQLDAGISPLTHLLFKKKSS